jgi:hypothetical protein
MTTATTNPTLDLYREVHKGLRRALFGVCEMAGALDPEDETARQEFVSRFADLDLMLTLHHGHEDAGPLGDLIARITPEFVAELEAAHAGAVDGLAELRSAVATFGPGSGTAEQLYGHISAFTAGYLAHMNFEEKTVMAALTERSTFDELLAVQIGIRTSVPPDQMVVFMRSMLPAMNPDERTDMLGGMKAGAPPEIFDIFWATACDVLTADQLAVVADHIGMTSASVTG